MNLNHDPVPKGMLRDRFAQGCKDRKHTKYTKKSKI